MPDLDAIRSRLMEPPDGWDFLDDANALLAEVDALNEVVLALQQAVEREGAEVDRLTALWESASVGYIRDTERARIRAAVEGLLACVLTVERPMDALDGPIPTGRYPMPPGELVVTAAPGRDGLVDRAAVLAAIEGAEHE